MAQCRSTLSSDPGPRYERCKDEALIILRKAADDWALGDPEQPPTSEVLKQILLIFEKQKFLHRPF
jgi:hypothetical protein